MDAETGQSLALDHNVGGLAKFLTSCSEGTKKDVGHFNNIWKHPGDINNTCSTHVPDSPAVSNDAASPSRYLLNKSLQANPYSGSGREMQDYASTSPAFHTAACGAGPLCNCHPHVSHLSVDNGGMESPGDHLKASQAPPPSTDTLVEGCPRRFLTHDDSGSNRMLINSPPANAFNAALPASSLNKAYMSYVMPPSEKFCDGKGVGLFVSSFPPAPHVPLAGMPNYCAHYLWPQHTAMDSMSSTSDICHMPHFAHGETTVVEVEADHGDGSPEVSSFSHENTEDIEALLSSDVDEVSSTGHSPCDLEENSFLPVGGPCETPSSFQAKSRNRKRHLKDDDDLCSTATSTSKGGGHTSLLDVVDTVGVETKLSLPFQGVDWLKTMSYDTTMLGKPCTDEVSSYNGANNKKRCRELGSLHQQPPLPINANILRKEKIKNILHLMREVIPGGETMDTAFVLDGAIQCIRTLQTAVNKLQAMQVPK